MSKVLIELLRLGYQKLGPLGIANVMLVFALIAFVAIEAFCNFLVTVTVILSKVILQGINKEPQVSTDTTPSIIYAGLLFLCFLACILVLKKHHDGELW